MNYRSNTSLPFTENTVPMVLSVCNLKSQLIMSDTYTARWDRCRQNEFMGFSEQRCCNSAPVAARLA